MINIAPLCCMQSYEVKDMVEMRKFLSEEYLGKNLEK